MSSPRDGQPGVSIHVVNSGAIDGGEKEKGGDKRNVNKSRTKKRKREGSGQGTAQKPEAATAMGKKEVPGRTTSFRHLFSFADTGGEAGPYQVEPNKADEANGFSLFGNGFKFGSEDQHGEGAEGDGLARSERERSDLGYVVTNAAESQPDEAHLAQSGASGPMEREYFETSDAMMPEELEAGGYYDENEGAHQHQEFWQDSRSVSRVWNKTGKFEQDRTVEEVPEMDSSPQGILAMAKKFCRQQSVEELEAEWCAVDGIREQMKRDFKLKRRNSLRDRKLGSAQH